MSERVPVVPAIGLQFPQLRVHISRKKVKRAILISLFQERWI